MSLSVPCILYLNVEYKMLENKSLSPVNFSILNLFFSWSQSRLSFYNFWWCKKINLKKSHYIYIYITFCKKRMSQISSRTSREEKNKLRTFTFHDIYLLTQLPFRLSTKIIASWHFRIAGMKGRSRDLLPLQCSCNTNWKIRFTELNGINYGN